MDNVQKLQELRTQWEIARRNRASPVYASAEQLRLES